MDIKLGELREDRGGACLAGTLSSRMYLKQANHHAQITLEQYTERLSAFARIQGPVAAGLYTLRFDVVEEGVAWFSSKGATFPAVAERVVVPTFGAVYTVPASALGPRGATITVPVTLTNAGSLTWDPAQKFDLAYHLFTPSGAVFVWDGARTLLAAPVAPGASVTLNATVTLPGTAGSFALKFDLVQEGVSWFSGQGVPAESISLTIQ